MSTTSSSRWWQGERGEWYVAAQLALILLVFFGPRTTAALPHWPEWLAGPAWLAGTLLMIPGAALLLAALLKHGRKVTPLPYPVAGAPLQRGGAYRVVRHPMYAGGVALAYGWALFVHGSLTLFYATLLLVFADIKATREERWLVAAYPEYPEYQKAVPKIIPFIR